MSKINMNVHSFNYIYNREIIGQLMNRMFQWLTYHYLQKVFGLIFLLLLFMYWSYRCFEISCTHIYLKNIYILHVYNKFIYNNAITQHNCTQKWFFIHISLPWRVKFLCLLTRLNGYEPFWLIKGLIQVD